jgi:hypothetical protein
LEVEVEADDSIPTEVVVVVQEEEEEGGGASDAMI